LKKGSEKDSKKDSKEGKGGKRVAYPDGVFPKGVSAEEHHAKRVGY